MGWFDDQIKQRKINDQALCDETFVRISDAVTGEKMSTEGKLEQSRDAVVEILRYYGYKSKGEVPRDVKDLNEQLEYMCRPYGIMRRSVRLTKGWYKDAVGPFLARKKEDGAFVAVIPTVKGYALYENGKYVKISRANADSIEVEAFCFYKPFPVRKITPIDLLIYSFKTRPVSDYVFYGILMGISTLLGLLTPKITNFLYSTVLEESSVALLSTTILMLICINISTIIFNLYKDIFVGEMGTKMDISVGAATMMRILSLPANFFRKYSSGDLSTRAGNLTSLTKTLNSLIFGTGLTSLFSLVYIGSIYKYAPSLVIPAMAVIIVTLLFSLFITFKQMKITREKMEIDSKLSGMEFAMVSGIQKIRLSAAEKRAFSRWGNLYAQSSELQYHPPFLIRVNTAITLAISLVGTIVMYYFTLKSGIGVAEYAAFTTAYGMVSGAFASLASIALTAASVKPVLDMARPIMEAEPEISDNKEILTKLRGDIEIDNLSFRYTESMPLIVNELNLKIKPGEYVAIVGKTGCGKSTLIRLLLGFETAQKGSIFYDNKDIKKLDLKSLRQKIGTVLQDGKLFYGDMRSNISLSAPWLTLDEVWEAADIAGIGDDIRNMPMGMNTMISEGSGGVSGGQKQRILIARAIAPKPKILIFDEATSALDNITQKQISEALDNLKCTRIIIAHRLSTIRHCDRILFFEDGQIKESGTYDELIEKRGLFADLVERQRLDVEDDEGK